MREREAQCLLGNGECPKTCDLYSYALEITNTLGDNFDPQESRTRIVFADVLIQGVTLVQVAALRARCTTEPRASREELNS